MHHHFPLRLTIIKCIMILKVNKMINNIYYCCVYKYCISVLRISYGAFEPAIWTLAGGADDGCWYSVSVQSFSSHVSLNDSP